MVTAEYTNKSNGFSGGGEQRSPWTPPQEHPQNRPLRKAMEELFSAVEPGRSTENLPAVQLQFSLTISDPSQAETILSILPDTSRLLLIKLRVGETLHPSGRSNPEIPIGTVAETKLGGLRIEAPGSQELVEISAHKIVTRWTPIKPLINQPQPTQLIAADITMTRQLRNNVGNPIGKEEDLLALGKDPIAVVKELTSLATLANLVIPGF